MAKSTKPSQTKPNSSSMDGGSGTKGQVPGLRNPPPPPPKEKK